MLLLLGLAKSPYESSTVKIFILPIISFFLKHCMKLNHYEGRKVTKPYFPGRLSIFYQQYFKKSVFDHFLENSSLLLAEIEYLDSSQHCVHVFYITIVRKIHFHPFLDFFISNFQKPSFLAIFLKTRNWSLSTSFLLTPCFGKLIYTNIFSIKNDFF